MPLLLPLLLPNAANAAPGRAGERASGRDLPVVVGEATVSAWLPGGVAVRSAERWCSWVSAASDRVPIPRRSILLWRADTILPGRLRVSGVLSDCRAPGLADEDLPTSEVSQLARS